MKNFIAFKQKIKLGFELETQHTEGQGDDGEIDQDDANEAISDEVYEKLNDLQDMVSEHSSSDFLKDLTWQDFNKVTRALNIHGLEDLCEYDDSMDYQEIYESERESVEYNFDYSDYMESGVEGVAVPKGMEVVKDESVEGVELRTIGGNKYANTLEMVKEVFKLDHTIDEDCSFHIHASLANIITPEMIPLATEYILCNIFKYSWASDRMNNSSFFAPSLDGRPKYSLIRNHTYHGTLEFRIFGNISNPTEAKQAIDLTLDALWYAYTNKGQALLADGMQDWKDLCKQAISNKTSLIEILTLSEVA